MRKSTLSGITAVLLAGALAAGVCCAGYASRNADGKWFKNSDLSTWHWSDKSPADDNKEPPNSGELVNGIESNGIKLLSARISPEDYEEYGIDTYANTAYSMTAIVNEDAADKSVLGTIRWKNSSSAWANGKNLLDYVTFNQTVEYGLDFTLTVKQEFGEPVEFEVYSVMDRAVKAVCQIDYLKEMQSFSAVINPSIPSNNSGRLYVGDKTNNVEIVPTYGVGTVTGSISNLKLRMIYNSALAEPLTSRLNGNSLTSGYLVRPTGFTVNGAQDGFKFPLTVSTFLTGTGNAEMANIMINNTIYEKSWYEGTGVPSGALAGISSITYTVTYTYGSDYIIEKSYRTDTVHNFRRDGVSAIKTITNIAMDKNNIVVLPN